MDLVDTIGGIGFELDADDIWLVGIWNATVDGVTASRKICGFPGKNKAQMNVRRHWDSEIAQGAMNASTRQETFNHQ